MWPRPAHHRCNPRQGISAADTTISGEGRITLSGGGAQGVFSVSSRHTLTLQQLTVREEGGTENWAIIVGSGATLRATGVTVEACSRGAIYNSRTLQVTRCPFDGNRAASSGAIQSNSKLALATKRSHASVP